MTLHCMGHLNVMAVIRGDEVRGHQQQDDVGPFELDPHSRVEVVAGPEAAIVPRLDQALTLHGREGDLQPVAQHLVLVRVGEEDRGHASILTIA
jgi:hypothetical protein